MRHLIAIGVVGLLQASSPLAAQVARDHGERASDRRQIGADRGQLAADVADVRRVERLVAELAAARASGNRDVERAVQARIGSELRREAAEGRRDLAQDRVEKAGSRSEIRSETQEIRRDRRDAATATSPAEGADDRRDLRRDRADRRDDVRDLRDDRRDAAASATRARRQTEIIGELRQIQSGVTGGDAAATERQRRLLDEFLDVSRADAKATGRELGEDHRELREDRRETRDDRRERREPK